MSAAQILTVLKNVPWNKVITNAGHALELASRLKGMVGKKSAGSDTQPSAPSESISMADLARRTITLESSVEELHKQMLASSDLIDTLAEQNAQLVARVETSRKQILWLGVLSAIAAAVALISATGAFSGHGA